MQTWDPLYGTAVRNLQGLGRSRAKVMDLFDGMAGVGATVFDDGSILGDDGSWSMPSTDGALTPIVTGPMNADTGGNPQGDSSFWSNIGNIFTSAVSAKQSYDINQINLERAKKGQPLLTSSQVANLQPGVRVGVAPDTQKMILYIALGLGAVYLLPKMLK